jgi:hypothetical protein
MGSFGVGVILFAFSIWLIIWLRAKDGVHNRFITTDARAQFATFMWLGFLLAGSGLMIKGLMS